MTKTVNWADPESGEQMCSVDNCNLCEKLNEVGAMLFPKMSVFSKEFDAFGSLFYHTISKEKTN